jgi:hypothetical protein
MDMAYTAVRTTMDNRDMVLAYFQQSWQLAANGQGRDLGDPQADNWIPVSARMAMWLLRNGFNRVDDTLCWSPNA